jgi:RNA polymerase sigma factor (sigma-70 family)
VRECDQGAWERLVKLFDDFVYGWFRRWGISESDAPDLVQNVFISVFSAIGKFDRESPGTTFGGWLWQIASNERHDFFRRRQPQQLDENTLASASEPRDDEMPGEGGAIMQRVLEFISIDFQPQTVEIFQRCVLQGQTSVEVAAELGMQKSAVRQSKRRVLERLKAEWSDLLGPEFGA